MTNEPIPLENLTRQQLADRLGVCRETIKRRENAGLLKPTRYGPRTVRYPIAYVRRLEREGIPPTFQGDNE
jgi:hypothetical protein